MKREVFAVRIDAELADQVRATVLHLQTIDPTVTVGSFVETALAAAVHEATGGARLGTPGQPRRGPRISTPRRDQEES